MKKFEPHKIQYCLKVDLDDPVRQRIHRLDLRDFLDGLTNHNRRILATHPRLPLLYHAGVRYEEEPIGKEDWCDVETVMQQGWGDCEDLACWRAAELQLAGVPAYATFLWKKLNPKVTLFHILVALPRRAPFVGPPQKIAHHVTHFPSGHVIEDPSRVLGMGSRPSQYAALAA